MPAFSTSKFIKTSIKTSKKPTKIYQLFHPFILCLLSLGHQSPTDAQPAITPYIDQPIINAFSVITTHISSVHKKLSINPYNSMHNHPKIYGHVIIVNLVLSVYSLSKIKPFHVPNATLTFIKFVQNSNCNKTL